MPAMARTAVPRSMEKTILRGRFKVAPNQRAKLDLRRQSPAAATSAIAMAAAQQKSRIGWRFMVAVFPSCVTGPRCVTGDGKIIACVALKTQKPNL